MPTLDLSRVLLDPRFGETVTVIRRTETVDAHGRSQVSSDSNDIFAVVTAGSNTEMVRNPEGQYQPNLITVHSLFRLVGPSNGFQPDVVVWNHRNYVVTKTFDYSHYGRGFVSAECASMEYLDTT